MEQYLILLFVLFSIVSALLERRKRARQLEEARVAREKRLERERQHGGTPAAEPELEAEEADQEEAWPFPMGGDPFDPRPPGRREARVPEEAEVEDEAMPEPTRQSRSLMEVLEDQLRDAEQRARREQKDELRRERERAEQMARALRDSRPRQRMDDLVQKRLDGEKAAVHRRQRSKWILNSRSARDAVVYAEILGPPKAERSDELWNSM